MTEDEKDSKEQYANWKAPDTKTNNVVDFASGKAKMVDKAQEQAELDRQKALVVDEIKAIYQKAVERRKGVDKIWEQKDPKSFVNAKDSTEEYYRGVEKFLAEIDDAVHDSRDEQELADFRDELIRIIEDLETATDELGGQLGIPSRKTLEAIDKLPPDAARIIRNSIDQANRK